MRPGHCAATFRRVASRRERVRAGAVAEYPPACTAYRRLRRHIYRFRRRSWRAADRRALGGTIATSPPAAPPACCREIGPAGPGRPPAVGTDLVLNPAVIEAPRLLGRRDGGVQPQRPARADREGRRLPARAFEHVSSSTAETKVDMRLCALSFVRLCARRCSRPSRRAGRGERVRTRDQRISTPYRSRLRPSRPRPRSSRVGTPTLASALTLSPSPRPCPPRPERSWRRAAAANFVWRRVGTA